MKTEINSCLERSKKLLEDFFKTNQILAICIDVQRKCIQAKSSKYKGTKK